MDETNKAMMVRGSGLTRTNQGGAASSRAARVRQQASVSKPSGMNKRPTMETAFRPVGKSTQGEVMSNIECPHCGEGISRGYAVKSLVMIAKSEGNDHLSDELQSLDEPDTEKAVTGPTNYAGNKVASHRGKAPGSTADHPRAGKKKVERANKPTNPVSEDGMAKSLFPCHVGQPQIVSYGYGDDQIVSKGVEDGSLDVGPARNFRAEREAATGEHTPE